MRGNPTNLLFGEAERDSQADKLLRETRYPVAGVQFNAFPNRRAVQRNTTAGYASGR
jgi:hypothetical protein